MLRALGLAAMVCAASSPCLAGNVLDRIRAEGVLRCGAAERDGVATSDDPAAGLAVDICRALATAVLGPGARIAFRLYEPGPGFDPVRAGEDDVAFLSADLVGEEGLAAAIVPGPTVFIERIALMVPESSAVHRLADLEGAGICFMIGGAGQAALEDASGRARLSFTRFAFSEEVEMLDAYNARRCDAIADEATTLARLAATQTVNQRPSRILDLSLATCAVFAATPTGDGAWSAAVAWAVDALVAAARPPSPWQGGARISVPGLRSDWRREMLGVVGSYQAIWERNLGAGSTLRLPPGPNAPWPDGLLLRLGAE
ncbi:MAG: hypothetical protein JOZ05_10720 [Acetobacteraceae bacterium]|nr:hypothetical protein [Acetobacteraceae bacterium]